jgi:translation initiation factor 2D
MFKRPHSSKTTTPIRSSDLRKLRQEILLQFPTSLTKDKDKLQLLLPDGTLTGKAKSHLDQQMTIFYSSNGDPRWFRTNDNDSNLVPTCYTLDLLNDLLPRLSTNESVVENLISGSNLFLSGVDNSSIHELPQEIGKGDLCSIAVKERVVAVGYLASGRDELLKTNTGTAVITLHARGDYLWESGSKLELTSSSIKPSIPMPIPTESPTSVVEEEQDSLTRDQVDEILHRSILLTISTLPTSNYPIPASSFYSSHILPNRPLLLTSSNVDLKKSNYKKLQQLIKYCHKQGWLVSKEVRGELLIMSGNQKHQDVLNLKKFKTVGSSSSNVETSSNTTTTTTSNSVTTTTTSSSSVVVVNEYFKPCSPKIKQILSLIPHSPPPNDFYSFQILKQLFLNYLTNISKLVHPNSQKHFYTTSPPPPPSDNKKKETLSLESLSHQELLNSVLFNHNNHNEKLGGGGVMTKDEGFKEFLTNKGNFTEFWGLSLSLGVDNKEEEEEKEEILQKGRPPVIKIQIKNVGKRQVTLITGKLHFSSKEVERL